MTDPTADATGRERGHPEFDPRDVVTPHAFEVDETLLDTPLAAPWQRLVALLIDLFIAGLIANVAGALVGFVVAYVFYRLATQTPLDRWWKRWGRGVLVALGAVILFGVSVALVEDVEEWGAAGPSLTAVVPGVQPDTSGDAPPRDEEFSADTLAPELLAGEGFGPDDPPLPADTGAADQDVDLLRRYARALSTRDTARLDTLAGPVQSLVSGPRLETLNGRLRTLAEQNLELQNDVERLRTQVQNPSLWRMARATANDLGLTVGWIGLYFTLFLAWWGGRTPGKSLLGIRVVRLSGEPLGLWEAFERFGGYAAGLATGLLGFVQLYWDPNRQAIHDRVARTVVVRTRRDPGAGRSAADADSASDA
jgi:uncharacterized RDD family membrane protein YckC